MTHMEQVLEGPATGEGDICCGLRMRIADILLVEEEEEEEEEESESGVDAEFEMGGLRRRQGEVGPCGFQCSSPGRAFSRWFRWRKEKKDVVGQVREKEEREFGDGSGSLGVSRIRTKVENGSPGAVDGKDESGDGRLVFQVLSFSL